MRELHECQAEVFRRSEKRIKERKKRRNHMLMACIPLVLCITLFGAFLFPQMNDFKQAPESSNEQFSDAMGTDAAGGLFWDSVEVSGNGISNYYTAVEDVQLIVSLINEAVAIPETSDGKENNDFTAEDSSSIDIQGEQKDKGYKILVQRSDGTSTEYQLVGSVLIDQTTQQEYPVSEETIMDLKDALGIPRN